MPTTHWKGVPVPDAGDDLLAAWTNALDAAGIVFPAQSVAAGREILSKAEAAGHAPTAAHPAYLDVGGILYRSDGAKNGAVWVLAPINEVQAVESRVQLTNTLALKDREYSGATQVDIGVRPYDRLVQVAFTVWGRVAAGDIDATILIMDRQFRARFPNDSTGATVTVTGMVVVPAGRDPKIRAGFTGAYGKGGTFSVTGDSSYSSITSTATPRSMA
jgi:hypothetical protein